MLVKNNLYFNNQPKTNIKNKDVTKNYTSSNALLPQFHYPIISFRGMKKTQFEGIDFLVVEKFKPPIEKFRTVDYLYDWADGECEKIYNKDFFGRTNETIAQRIVMIEEWKDYLEQENLEYSPTEKLLIMNGVTKNLKPDNDDIPPALNKGVLADTIFNLKHDLELNPKSNFDFNKTYMNNLREFYLSDTKGKAEETKWVVIPSKLKDPDNFNSNVEKLKALSNKSWCTKSNNAEPYLAVGDFHIYLENGNAKLGIRFIDDTVQEIQGEYNNSRIPLKYLNKFIDYQEENKFKLNKKTTEEIVAATKLQQKVDAVKKDIEPAIAENNYSKIFEHFGMEVSKDKNGMLILSHFDEPEGITFDDLGINEDNMFKNVVKINGDAKFCRSAMTDLRNLKEIGGNANFSFSKFKTLGKLEKVGGNVDVEWAYGLEDLGELEEIGGDLRLDMNKIKTFTNLKRIGGNANLKMSDIDDLGSLEEIGGDFKWEYGLKSLGNLEFIGGNADFSHAKLNSLGKLKSIEGNANFNFAEIGTLSNLEEVGGDLNISASEIGDYGKLKTVGGRIKGMSSEKHTVIEHLKNNNNGRFDYEHSGSDEQYERQARIDMISKRIMQRLREEGKIKI